MEEAQIKENPMPAKENPVSIVEDNPKQIQNELMLNRCSNILSNVAFAMTILSFLIAIGTIVSIFVAYFFVFIAGAVLVVISLATLGIVYLVTDMGKAWTWLGQVLNKTENLADFFNKLYAILPYSCVGGIIFSVGAIICLSFSKNEHKKSKIVWLSICLGVLLISGIVVLAAVGGARWTN